MTLLTREEWVERYIARTWHPENFARNPEFYTRRARREWARYRLHIAVRCGEITKPSVCSECDRKNVRAREMHAHHLDYQQPLLVKWLCRWCHESQHKGPHISKPLSAVV